MSLSARIALFALAFTCGIGCLLCSPAMSSDWDEDSSEAAKAKNSRTKPEEQEAAREPAPEPRQEPMQEQRIPDLPSDANRGDRGNKPLAGKVEKSHDSLRIQRKNDGPGGLNNMVLPDLEKTGGLEGKAIDDELRGMVKDGQLQGLAPQLDNQKPLTGRAELKGGKAGKGLDPDEDDSELLVEWDRWHNRFLRAVQLGTQENVNNPDPDDYERPRVDPRTGMITTRYPLGTGAAFSCIVTDDGQIKNLELFETSGFPKYDRAVLKAVQQLAGTHILKFPKGSHRKTVLQPGRIKTASQSEFKYHHFGDVERVQH